MLSDAGVGWGLHVSRSHELMGFVYTGVVFTGGGSAVPLWTPAKYFFPVFSHCGKPSLSFIFFF